MNTVETEASPTLKGWPLRGLRVGTEKEDNEDVMMLICALTLEIVQGRRSIIILTSNAH